MAQRIDARLASAAYFVREGSVFCDVGTDHAYLPIYLLQAGRIPYAIAADIGEGPLASAEAHLAEVGLSDKVKTVLTDGLCGLEHEGIRDIAVCGMGGELICEILARAPFVRDPAIRLILQPMTHAADLRRYLAENGFCTEAERLSLAAGRVYTCLCAAYTGERRMLTPSEAFFGLPPQPDPAQRALYAKMLTRMHASLVKQIHGKEAGGGNPAEERALLADCEKLLKEYR